MLRRLLMLDKSALARNTSVENDTIDIKIEPVEYSSEEPHLKKVKLEDLTDNDIKTETDSGSDEDSTETDADEWTDSGNSDQEAPEDGHSTPELEVQWEVGPTALTPIAFTETPGLTYDLPDYAKPIDYFYMLADDTFFDLLVAQTNSHAEYLLLERGGGRIGDWKDVTKEELKIFFGLFLHMGTIQYHRANDYWRRHRLLGIQCFSQHMGRNRFLLILKCLQFWNEPEPQEAHKVKAVVDYFNDKIETIYVPNKQLSLDDFMVLYRRKLMFCQGIKNKNRKYGVKLYMLTESTGVILRCLVKQSVSNPTKVVMQLMQKKLNKGYSLYMDSAYTSYTLAKSLLDAQTYCSGVLRNTLYVPEEFRRQKLEHGESSCRYANGVMVGKWQRRKDVLYMSTEHGNDMCRIHDRKGHRIMRPTPLTECNKNMPGRYFQEKVMSYYPRSTKPHGWDKQIGLHIVFMMLYNAHLLYSINRMERISFYDFRLAVLEEMLPSEVEVAPTNKTHDHLPKKCPKKPCGKTMRKKCRECWNRGVRKDTQYHCRDCPSEPGLCLEPCFFDFHNKNKS